MALLRIGVVVLGLALPAHHAAAQALQRGDAARAKPALAAIGKGYGDVRLVAGWVLDSGDHADLPFVIVDKVRARVFVFDAGGRKLGSAPALLGLARGDHTVPGIGEREYSEMLPADRTTPAGRFVAARGMNARGEDVLWVDYDAAISLHRVVTSRPEERRLERLATPTPLDNRISYGCINVPVRFYEEVVSPAIGDGDAIVYVLPETRPARELFGISRRL
jgi:hypothetical protein